MVPVDCILRFFFLVVFLWSVGWHVGALWQLLSGVSSQLVEHHDLVCLSSFLTLCVFVVKCSPLKLNFQLEKLPLEECTLH